MHCLNIFLSCFGHSGWAGFFIFIFYFYFLFFIFLFIFILYVS